jgi:hypothetical protein
MGAAGRVGEVVAVRVDVREGVVLADRPGAVERLGLERAVVPEPDVLDGRRFGGYVGLA